MPRELAVAAVSLFFGNPRHPARYWRVHVVKTDRADAVITVGGDQFVACQVCTSKVWNAKGMRRSGSERGYTARRQR
jgi:hypothetical protein